MISNRRWIVALPAKNEAERITASVAALDAAAAASPLPVHLLVFANNCSDGTRRVAEIAAARADHVTVAVEEITLASSLAHAGGARAASVEAALATFGSEAGDYLLTTDADARVAPTMFSRCEAAFDRGADLVLASIACRHDLLDPVTDAALAWGTPQVLWRHRVRQLVETVRTGVVPCPPLHDDYGGAGIAVTVGAYRRLGGFPAVPCDEDKMFVDAADAAGLRVDRQSGAVVTVLARATGRAVGGMASALARNAEAARRGDRCFVERHDVTVARLLADPSHAHAFAPDATDVEPVEDAIAGLDRLISSYERRTA